MTVIYEPLVTDVGVEAELNHLVKAVNRAGFQSFQANLYWKDRQGVAHSTAYHHGEFVEVTNEHPDSYSGQ